MDGVFDSVSNLWSSITSATSSAANTVIQSIEDIPAEWNAKVAELKAKAADFAATFDDLANLAPIAARDPQTKSQYDALMARGMSIKAKIQSVTSAIDNVYRMAQNALSGFGGLGNMGDLGLIPLIPIAIIVGAIALITSWLTDAYMLRTKLQAAQASGASAAQITAISQGSGGGIFPSFSSGSLMKNAGLLLLIGAGILILLPQIKKALKK